ncbi:MAG: acyl-ACP--UDP-N-acetylglucosamine O-acyltransferase [Gemmatimonadetes bacterium]|nr:acyl-ACP--UDP-N-acetylglucosamine O-acyltransferase [Gemmatimonadota bacterium]
MKARIHATAIVDLKAEIGPGVEIGPWAYIGPQCEIGAGCVIAARATLESHVKLAAQVKVGIGSVLGGLPQDLKFKGEETWVEIGEGTTIREYATINRGTAESWKTSVGKNSFLMSYVHLAHDCHVGDNVIISNGTQLAGHVEVHDFAGISGLCAVHQFTRIGAHAYIGGCSRIPKDVPPYVRAAGNPIALYGLNSVGLQRRGFKADTIAELKKAYRLFFRSELNLSQAIERAKADLKPIAEVQAMIAFLEASERGATL